VNKPERAKEPFARPDSVPSRSGGFIPREDTEDI